MFSFSARLFSLSSFTEWKDNDDASQQDGSFVAIWLMLYIEAA